MECWPFVNWVLALAKVLGFHEDVQSTKEDGSSNFLQSARAGLQEKAVAIGNTCIGMAKE